MSILSILNHNYYFVVQFYLFMVFLYYYSIVLQRQFQRGQNNSKCRQRAPLNRGIFTLAGSCRTRTTSQNCCVFPFIYRGRRYNRCTSINSRGRPWCAITPSYDVDKLYGYCGGRGGIGRLLFTYWTLKVSCIQEYTHSSDYSRTSI